MAARFEGRTVSIFTIDAFTDQTFKGNPAAVCLVQRDWEPTDDVLQSIATEMNLSATAFIQHTDSEGDFLTNDTFRLRWFSSQNELPLCGHATMASAAVLFFCSGNPSPCITFSIKSEQKLFARRENDQITLDFPLNPTVPQTKGDHLDTIKAICDPSWVTDVEYSATTKKLLLRLQDKLTRQDLEKITVDPNTLQATNTSGDVKGVIVTLKSMPSSTQPFDFISRFFTPWNGIPEDPCTGSAHTVMADYWRKQTGKTEFYACQCSKRSGQLRVRIVGDRAELSGKARMVLRGSMQL